MSRWQYKVVEHKSLVGGAGSELREDREREAFLDRFGRDGWELITVTVQSYRREYDPTALQGYSFFSYFFKREER
jgi:uncharacterized protein YjhX (UPF0386 family)